MYRRGGKITKGNYNRRPSSLGGVGQPLFPLMNLYLSRALGVSSFKDERKS